MQTQEKMIKNNMCKIILLLQKQFANKNMSLFWFTKNTTKQKERKQQKKEKEKKKRKKQHSCHPVTCKLICFIEA